MEIYEKILRQIKESDASEEQKEYLEHIAMLSKEAGVPIILDTYHLSDVLGVKWKTLKELINNSQKMYYNFNISKKSGGKRKISMPEPLLKEVQTLIKEKILMNIAVSDRANGFVATKSILTNAQEHLDKEKVLNIDLKDFFPSIHKNRIYYIFNSMCGYSKEVSYCLTQLVTYKNSLPQGAPTSPILSNLVSYKMDIRLDKLSEKLGVTYTRYADDITFSGSKAVINTRFLQYVTTIIKDCGFNINHKKTRFASKGRRQEVTGLIVNNQKVAVPKEYIKEIKQEMYYINKYGIKSHREKVGFENRYYKEHLLGKIMFVKSINCNKGEKLLEEFNNINWR